MTKVTFTNHCGQSREVDMPAGQTLMEGARNAGIEGIVADCGGACACATCHVYVDAAWLERLPPREPVEEDMLDFAASPKDYRSRLSCQIFIEESMEGLKIDIPETQ